MVWLVATLAVALLVALGQPVLAGRAPATTPFEQVLVRCCVSVGLLAAGWLWCGISLVVADAARSRLAGRASIPLPPMVHHLVLLACGVALTGLGAPAAAHDPTHHPTHDPDPARAALSGLPYPDRASLAPRAGHRSGRRVVEVRAGDTLWALASQDLPPDAPAVAVTRLWHRIHMLNRRVIGDDPDLIQPHQRLRLPRR